MKIIKKSKKNKGDGGYFMKLKKFIKEHTFLIMFELSYIIIGSIFINLYFAIGSLIGAIFVNVLIYIIDNRFTDKF
jgi:uncharacterized membrane protein YagU involved in acid resistance